MPATTLSVTALGAVGPWLTGILSISGLVYFRGWRVLHRIPGPHFQTWRLKSFLGGLLTIWIAIGSPLDWWSSFLLSAHMVQHLLLLSVAPPLLLLGNPIMPLLRGLPRSFSHDGLGPFLRWDLLNAIGRFLTHPAISWFAMVLPLCAWHIPAAYDVALRDPAWHKVEHASFFLGALLFWWPVVRPHPSRVAWPLWILPLYLLAADLVNTALGAFLTFSERVLYTPYVELAGSSRTDALADQVLAGVIMWVPGSLLYLGPAVFIAVQLLSPNARPIDPPGNSNPPKRISKEPHLITQIRLKQKARFNALDIPVVSRVLRSRLGRTRLQIVLLFISVLVVADGLFGSPATSENLAGVLPWTYWRAFTVVALLAAGNLFCMACPFTLLRSLGLRRTGGRQRAWPRPLRSKWLPIGLLVLFFWIYEVFRVWDHPSWTAAIIVGYFVAAFLVDTFFHPASFCKYVCPIGQFHFVNSLVSPFEVKVIEADVCNKCLTHDCLRGNESQRGCEMGLYLPSKVGNLDCTFCLDCVRACPHENVGLLLVQPGADLMVDPKRSSIGKVSRRLDIAALSLVVVFGAFTNAALMTEAVSTWSESIARRLGLISSSPVKAALALILLVLAPLILSSSAVATVRAFARTTIPTRELFCKLALALAPLGLTMWCAHFLFHLITGWRSLLPALEHEMHALGIWSRTSFAWDPGAIASARELLDCQLLLIDFGLLLTLYVGWRISRGYTGTYGSALRLIAPWSVLPLGLYCSGVWIFLQPMQMLGM